MKLILKNNNQKSVIEATIESGDYNQGVHPYGYKLTVEAIATRKYTTEKLFNTLGSAKTFFTKQYYKGVWVSDEQN